MIVASGGEGGRGARGHVEDAFNEARGVREHEQGIVTLVSGYPYFMVGAMLCVLMHCLALQDYMCASIFADMYSTIDLPNT